MAAHFLELSEDHIAPQGELSLPALAGSRIVYIVAGAVVADDTTYGENSAFFGTAACAMQAPTGAQLWRWELRRDPAPDHPACKASHAVTLDPHKEYLMRCDRVDFPPQGIAHTHVHAGPGIRILLRGTIRIQVAGAETALAPGEAWFERGPDSVLALTDEKQPTSFIRTMILPRDYAGRPSIRYTLSADADKPKVQQYTRFVEEFIEH